MTESRRLKLYAVVALAAAVAAVATGLTANLTGDFTGPFYVASTVLVWISCVASGMAAETLRRAPRGR